MFHCHIALSLLYFLLLISCYTLLPTPYALHRAPLLGLSIRFSASPLQQSSVLRRLPSGPSALRSRFDVGRSMFEVHLLNCPLSSVIWVFSPLPMAIPLHSQPFKENLSKWKQGTSIRKAVTISHNKVSDLLMDVFFSTFILLFNMRCPRKISQTEIW